MADWNEIKHDLGKTASELGREMTKLGNTAASKLRLNSLKVELCELYERLGKATFGRLDMGESVSATDVAPIMKLIYEKKEEIDTHEKELERKNGK
jgi:hypothetical protein